MTYYIGYGKKLSDLDRMFNLLVFSTPAKVQPFLNQILRAQLMYSDTRAFSNVLFFADSGASDAYDPSDLFSKNTMEQLVISATNTWHSKLTLILTQTSTKPLDTSGNHFDVYRRLAVATHGDLFVIDKTGISELMTNVLNNYHNMENLAVRYKFNCTDMNNFDVPVEYNSSKTIRILLTVDKNDVEFDLPYLTDMNYTQLGVVSRAKYYSLYSLTTESTSIRVVSPTPGLVCSVRVFVDSNSAMLLSFTNNRQMDVGNFNMYKNIPQLATGLPLGFSGFDYIEIRPFDPSTGFGLSVSTRAYKRAQDATYAYEFDNLSDCTAGPYIQQVQLAYGNDVATRVLPGYCVLPGRLNYRSS
ncbi:hypothetical protein OESDEN_12113 [Oesophagostomum dentatum]|uniref:Uncharacterized protein n=1 Tax=Oesophagostomum dentatum TaxID=61180 RepID=A0A0B1SX79_OESDE|nr:hypothetical protein OESDEN_12113 [Oesophagostomum dentatum]